MNFQITVTYRRGKKTKALTFTQPIGLPLCDGIKFPGESALSSVAWVNVVSIVITPIAQN